MKQENLTKICCHIWFEPINFIQLSFLNEQSYKFPVGLDRLQIRCRLQNSCSLLNLIQISTRYDTLCLRIYLLPRLYIGSKALSLLGIESLGPLKCVRVKCHCMYVLSYALECVLMYLQTRTYALVHRL